MSIYPARGYLLFRSVTSSFTSFFSVVLYIKYFPPILQTDAYSRAGAEVHSQRVLSATSGQYRYRRGAGTDRQREGGVRVSPVPVPPARGAEYLSILTARQRDGIFDL